jgi:hypothetical protein
LFSQRLLKGGDVVALAQFPRVFLIEVHQTPSDQLTRSLEEQPKDEISVMQQQV